MVSPPLVARYLYFGNTKATNGLVHALKKEHRGCGHHLRKEW